MKVKMKSNMRSIVCCMGIALAGIGTLLSATPQAFAQDCESGFDYYCDGERMVFCEEGLYTAELCDPGTRCESDEAGWLACIPPSPDDMMTPESRAIIAEMGLEEIDEGLTESMEPLLILDGLADAVLAGNEEAMLAFEDLLVQMWSEVEDTELEWYRILETDQDHFDARFDTAAAALVSLRCPPPGVMEPMPTEPVEPVEGFGALRAERMGTIGAAAAAIAGYDPARQRDIGVGLGRAVNRAAKAEMVRDLARRTAHGDSRGRDWARALARPHGFPEWDCGPDPWGGPAPMDPPPVDPTGPTGGYTIEEMMRMTEPMVRMADRYACTFELFKQSPLGFQSYQLTNVTGRLGHQGSFCDNEELVLDGSGFGQTPALVELVDGSRTIALPVISWSDTRIEVKLPSNAPARAQLWLRIPFRTVQICGVNRTLYKAGSGMMVDVLKLGASIQANDSEIFRVRQDGQLVRSDKTMVHFSTQDAATQKVIRRDPSGAEVVVSQVPTGSFDFDGAGTDGVHTFRIEAENRCGPVSDSVQVDAVLGVKPVVEAFTVNNSTEAVIDRSSAVAVAWQVRDQQNLSVTRRLYTPSGNGSTSTLNAQSNGVTESIQEDVDYILRAEGSIRRRQDLVTVTLERSIFVKPQVTSFTASTSTAKYNDRVNFNWTSYGNTTLLKGQNTIINSTNGSGSYSHRLSNSTAFQEVFGVRAVNPRRSTLIATSTQPLTINYLPSVTGFKLVANAINHYADNAVQPGASGANITISRNIRSSGYLHQEFGVQYQLRNAQNPRFCIKGVCQTSPSTLFRGNGLLGDPTKDEKRIVTVSASNPNSPLKVLASGSVTYKDPIRYWDFCRRPLNVDGSVSTIVATTVRTTGRTQAEAKAKVNSSQVQVNNGRCSG